MWLLEARAWEGRTSPTRRSREEGKSIVAWTWRREGKEKREEEEDVVDGESMKGSSSWLEKGLEVEKKRESKGTRRAGG